MKNDRPQNIDQYKKWLKENHQVEISERTITYYDAVTNGIKRDFEESDFWSQLVGNLPVLNDEYLLNRGGYDLLVLGVKQELGVKPFDSFLSKTFRKNILENKRWPDKPENGWILPNNWYSRINDLIRTLLQVKYLDGVEFLKSKVESICKECGMECKAFLEATEEGYYAAHLYTRQEFEIPKINWDTERVDISIEIQITTQIQEVIRKLLHKYYEERRTGIKEEGPKWQWNYESDEFVANYLGHILHYMEGMIMEIREKQKEEI